MAAYQVSKIRYVPDIYTLPSLATFLYHFAVCIILDDAGYYFIHRLDHKVWNIPSLIKLILK